MKRFWAKVDKGESCWAWTGATGKKGYGKFWLDGGCKAAHRVAYELHYGPITNGLHVLHACDNPSCVRPDHLWLGTNSDNQRDSVRKKRHSSTKGSSNVAKLTPDAVRLIRRSRREGWTQRALAKRFGVSLSAVNHASTGRNWGHVR